MDNKQETTKLVPPSQVSFWNTAVGKVLRASIYLAISAAIGGIIAAIADNPLLFGALTPLINIVLVTIKNLLDPSVKNI